MNPGATLAWPVRFARCAWMVLSCAAALLLAACSGATCGSGDTYIPGPQDGCVSQGFVDAILILFFGGIAALAVLGWINGRGGGPK